MVENKSDIVKSEEEFDAKVVKKISEICRLTFESAKNKLADQDMFTMLHEASANGLEQVVDGLCSKGATTEVRNKNGEAPLHLASYKGFTKVVKVLLAKGADKHA